MRLTVGGNVASGMHVDVSAMGSMFFLMNIMITLVLFVKHKTYFFCHVEQNAIKRTPENRM